MFLTGNADIYNKKRKNHNVVATLKNSKKFRYRNDFPKFFYRTIYFMTQHLFRKATTRENFWN